jgi:hypothetical protein
VKRETRFTSQCPANEIMSKIEETAKPLGFNVHKRNYKVTFLMLDKFIGFALFNFLFCFHIKQFKNSCVCLS